MPIAAPPFCFDFIIHENRWEVNAKTDQFVNVSYQNLRFRIPQHQKTHHPKPFRQSEDLPDIRLRIPIIFIPAKMHLHPAAAEVLFLRRKKK